MGLVTSGVVLGAIQDCWGGFVRALGGYRSVISHQRQKTSVVCLCCHRRVSAVGLPHILSERIVFEPISALLFAPTFSSLAHWGIVSTHKEHSGKASGCKRARSNVVRGSPPADHFHGGARLPLTRP